MKKLLVFIFLSSLLGACKTTGHSDKPVINNTVETIKVVVEYSGDLRGTNKGTKKDLTVAEIADRMDPKYTIDLVVSEKITMMEFIAEFHKQTGLETSYTLWGGAPPNRSSTEVSYYHTVNGDVVNPDNEQKALSDWTISNNSTVTVEIGGGGAVD